MYTVHALSDILGVDFNDLNAYDEISLEVQVYTYLSTGAILTYVCPTKLKHECTITFKRSSTPYLYYLSSRVVYKGSETSIYLDRKSSDYLANPTPP